MLPAMVDCPAPQQALQPIEVTRTDDSTKVWALLRILSIELNHCFLQVLQEPSGNVLEHEDVVRRGAGLAGVVPAPLSDAPGGDPQVGRRVHDGWAFAAE